MKKMLITTTVNDKSTPLFLTQKIQKKLEIDFCFLHESTEEIKQKLIDNDYNYIYIRYPFNPPFNKSDIKAKLKLILDNRKNSYMVDNIDKLDDLYFEDKWEQYQVFQKFMPETKIRSNLQDVDNPNHITKKRISTRAEGIIFDSKELANKKICRTT